MKFVIVLGVTILAIVMLGCSSMLFASIIMLFGGPK
jgi:hypothetical protein